MICHIYAGSYTDNGCQTSPDTHTSGNSPAGLYQICLDTETETLRPVQTCREADNPSFLALTSDYLYAVSERPRDGMISAYRRNPRDGSLTFLNSIPTRGDAMCHLNVWPDGRYFSAANYMSGSVFTGCIHKDGSLGELRSFCQHSGTGYLSATRQEGPHVHCTMLSEDGKRLYVSDLGLDQVFCYEIGEGGFLTPAGEKSQIRLPKGEGPRHFVLRNHDQLLYLTSELGNKVFVYRSEDGGITYQEVQAISTLPEDYTDENTAADLHFSRDGRFLYVSNRGMDSLVLYETDQSTGLLRTAGYYSSQGRGPRNFCITPDDRYLLIANQASGNLVLCRRNVKTGEITDKLDELPVNQVSFVTAVM